MRPLLGTVGVLAALGVGGTAYAVTSGGAPPAPATAVSSAAATLTTGPAGGGAGLRIRALLRRTDHATVEIKRSGQWVTYDLDRGTVTAVSPSSITLQRPDGQSITFTIGSATKFKGVGSESQVQLQKPALVLSTNGAAVRIRQASGPAAGGGAASQGTSPATSSAAGNPGGNPT